MSNIDFFDVQNYKSGDYLPPMEKEEITLLQLVKYAGASGDFNQIHFNEEFAKAVGLPTIIAHGMLSMGFLCEYAGKICGPNGYVQQVEARFMQMLSVGSKPICKGFVNRVQDIEDRKEISLTLWVENQNGEKVLEGEASLCCFKKSSTN